MLRRVVIGASLACMMAGAAYAVDEPAVQEDEGEGDACSQQLAATEESVRDKLESNTMSEADTEKVNELLDQADAQCTEGDMDASTQTLTQVKSLVAKAK